MKIKAYRNQNISAMARIGWIPSNSINSIEVYVHTDDSGMIPHFHVRKYSKNGHPEWETCIKFDSAEYYLHGRYKDRLPKGVAYEMNKMFKEVNPKRRGLTFWQSAIDDWNNNNSSIQLDQDLEQPDYCELQ